MLCTHKNTISTLHQTLAWAVYTCYQHDCIVSLLLSTHKNTIPTLPYLLAINTTPKLHWLSSCCSNAHRFDISSYSHELPHSLISHLIIKPHTKIIKPCTKKCHAIPLNSVVYLINSTQFHSICDTQDQWDQPDIPKSRVDITLYISVEISKKSFSMVCVPWSI